MVRKTTIPRRNTGGCKELAEMAVVQQEPSSVELHVDIDSSSESDGDTDDECDSELEQLATAAMDEIKTRIASSMSQSQTQSQPQARSRSQTQCKSATGTVTDSDSTSITLGPDMAMPMDVDCTPVEIIDRVSTSRLGSQSKNDTAKKHSGRSLKNRFAKKKVKLWLWLCHGDDARYKGCRRHR